MTDEPAAPARPSPTPPRRSPRPLGPLVIGAALLGAGILWLLDASGAVEIPWAAVAPGALILVGLALVVAARTGARTGGLVAMGIVLALVSALFSGADLRLAGGVGERTERPRTPAELRDTYELAAGKLVLDLRGLQLPAGETRIRVRVGLGELRVLVPRGVPVVARGTASAGEVDLLNRSADGLGAETTYRSEGFGNGGPRLSLDVAVGLGKVEVRE